MMIQIQLSPEDQSRLQREAERHGLAVDQFVRTLLVDRTDGMPAADPRPFPKKAGSEDWKREFRAWVESHQGLKLRPLSDEELRREYLYEDRGL